MTQVQLDLQSFAGWSSRGAYFQPWIMIVLLTAAYTASFIDRQVLNLLVGPIKKDLGLSDIEISILQGIAFSAAYIAMSPIFGRLADRVIRRNLLIVGVILWSVSTICCGLSQTHSQLMFARLGVGGAEACLTPAAWSMISDSFDTKTLPRAFSIYLMGPYLGSGLALIFGGMLLEAANGWSLVLPGQSASLAPWQLTFMAVGVPGILLALMLFFVREPGRHKTGPNAEHATMPFAAVRKQFMTHRAFYGNFYAGTACLYVALYAFPAWTPTFMLRRFDVTVASVGFQYGVLVLIAGSAGILCGPVVARLLNGRDRQSGLLLVPILCTGLLFPVSALLPFTTTYTQALTLCGFAALLYSLPGALSASALQLVTPSGMRGVASSLYVLVISIVGLGAAPTLVALISDRIFRDEAKIGEALAIVCATASLCGLIFLIRCLREFRALQQPSPG